MSGPHIPFEKRLGHDPSGIDPSGNMHYDLIAGHPIFDKAPKGRKRQKVLEEVFNGPNGGQWEAVLVDREPLQAIFNPKTRRFDLIDTQNIFDPNNIRRTKIWDGIEI